MPFLIAALLSLVLTGLARPLATWLGLVDRPAAPAASTGGAPGGPLKIHARPVPLLGGLAALTAALVATLPGSAAPPDWVLAGIGLATLVGFVDDVRPLSPVTRLAALGGAGALVAAGGVRFGPGGALGIAGTVLLVLALTQAVNLLDGQDGLAGGVGAIAALGLAGLALAHGHDHVPALALAGGLVGFCAWNLSPARVFLGNSGAYGLGAALAVLALPETYQHGRQAILATGLCLGVPAFELASTVARRLAWGSGLTAGDRYHSYDVLARRLGSRRRSTLAMWGASLLAAMAGIVAALAAAPALTVALAAALGLAAMAASLRLWGRAGTGVAVGKMRQGVDGRPGTRG